MCIKLHVDYVSSLFTRCTQGTHTFFVLTLTFLGIVNLCLRFFHLFSCGLYLPDTYFLKLWLCLLEILALRRSEIDFNAYVVCIHLSCVRLREEMDIHAESQGLECDLWGWKFLLHEPDKNKLFKIITMQKKVVSCRISVSRRNETLHKINCME